MDPGSSRDPIPPERTMVLASRREARGSARAWLAALSIVAGIATTSILFRTWPSHARPLPATSRDVAVMHAPVAHNADIEVTVTPAATAPDVSDHADRRGPTPPTSHVFEAVPITSPGEQSGAARSGVEAGHAAVAAAIEARPVTFVTMMEPVLVPEGLVAADSAPLEGPSGVAPLAVVTRAVLAAGKGITTGFRLTGASIKAVF